MSVFKTTVSVLLQVQKEIHLEFNLDRADNESDKDFDERLEDEIEALTIERLDGVEGEIEDIVYGDVVSIGEED